MDYAVVLYFDEKSESYLLEIMRNLCEAGVNRYMLDVGIRPHITLASWMNDEGRDLSKEIAGYADAVKGTGVLFPSIGIFPTSPKVVYLSPVKNDELLDLHHDFYRRLDGKINSYIPYYTPGQWVPHCTLATKLTEEEVQRSIKALLHVPFPIKATIAQVGLIKCNPVEEILSCELKFIQTI